MSIQGRRLIEIIEEVKLLGVMTIVGGPMATVEPESLEGLADVVFIGEADETWPQFLKDWERDARKAGMSSTRRQTSPNCRCHASTC